MRIAIPSDDGNNITAHTGRAKGFVIYEIKDNRAERIEYRSNHFTAHALGECNEDTGSAKHQHQSHDSLLDALQDCQVLIARGMGPRLVMDLEIRDIRALFCSEFDANTVAFQFAQGILETSGKSHCDRSH